MKKITIVLIASIIVLCGCSSTGTIFMSDGTNASFSLPVWHKSVDITLDRNNEIINDDGTTVPGTLKFSLKTNLDTTANSINNLVNNLSVLSDKAVIDTIK